jgi:membrane-associated phospholipid phosphatase/tRNA A-37 threonylcarbamoyl transferase component Bud32
MTTPSQIGPREIRDSAVVVPPPGPSGVRQDRRRRRPTGAAPPLPKSVGRTGTLWLVAVAALLCWVIVLFASPAARRLTDRVDSAALRQIAQLRTGWLTDVMTAIDRVGTGWSLTALAVGTIVLQMVFRRWRHLFTFLASFVVLQVVGATLYQNVSRPRPYDVTAIGRWAGYSFPSPPVGVLAAVLVGVAYALVPAGRARRWAKVAIAAVLGVLAFARLYLGVDHPFDVLVGLVLGVAIPLAAFRMFTPNDLVPVSYGRGKTAHLDVGGNRGEAIRRAIHEQLGLTVLDVKPVGLEGSGGSTPLRLRVAGDPETYLFAKLFAMNHVRADRWYKLGREILYGRLEDEARFSSVCRLVEYEDHALRLLRDSGIPTAAPCGIVEITPQREYMLVTGFIEDAQEIGDAEVDDGVIDEALGIIRRLWDAGLAHRDIKPANLLVRDAHVFLIDAFFVQVRPSPWRQAVDLGNMMLVLAVRTDAERVYERALRLFTPDEIAEAFAATRGVASPTQLRVVMKRDGRDLLDQFRRLAPPRRPIGLQRWSIRRVVLALGLVAAAIFAVTQITSLFKPYHDLPVDGSPDCGTGDLAITVAQSVPSATLVPCIAALPAGWDLGHVHVERDRTTFWLDSDLGGDRAVEATLTPPDECDVSGATAVPSDEVGADRYEQIDRLPPGLHSTRYYLFEGGCVTYRLEFADDATPAVLFDVDQALTFQPRSTLVEHVRETTDLDLCGAGATCVGG